MGVSIPELRRNSDREHHFNVCRICGYPMKAGIHHDCLCKRVCLNPKKPRKIVIDGYIIRSPLAGDDIS